MISEINIKKLINQDGTMQNLIELKMPKQCHQLQSRFKYQKLPPMIYKMVFIAQNHGTKMEKTV